MRLEPDEREGIKAVVARRDAHARVFLFGSRTDPDARGGGIDLQDRLGPQLFDLVVLGPQPSAFARAVAERAVAL